MAIEWPATTKFVTIMPTHRNPNGLHHQAVLRESFDQQILRQSPISSKSKLCHIMLQIARFLRLFHGLLWIAVTWSALPTLCHGQTLESQKGHGRNLFFLEPKYADRQPFGAFERVVVCIDANTCDDESLETLVFSNQQQPPLNAFRFQPNVGPETLRGVFWMQQGVGGSVLTSFASTRSGGGIDTGVWQENENGFAYLRLPIGDHSWGFALEPDERQFGTEDAARLADIVYELRIRKGSVGAPESIQFYVSDARIGSDCIRFSVWRFLFDLFLNFELNLITDENNPDKIKYPLSNIWRRRTSFFFDIFLVPFGNFNYNFVQIVDEGGLPIEPAYGDWVQWMKDNSKNRMTFYRIQNDRVDESLSC